MGFDLTTFVFTEDGDDAVFSDVLAIADGIASPFSAIEAAGPVDALGGRDLIDGTLTGTVDTADAVQAIGLLVTDVLASSAGNDKVFGSADFTLSAQSAAAEILGIFGDDTGLIETGDGRDRVEGSASATGGDLADIFRVVGVDEIDILAGAGNDQLTGMGSVSVGDGSSINEVYGIFAGGDVDSDMGDGRDRVTGIAQVEAGNNSTIGEVEGYSSKGMNTGAGNDRLLGSASVTAGDNTQFVEFQSASGISSTDILMGGGRDRIEGTATVSVGENSTIGNRVAGIESFSVDTGDSADTVIGTASVEAGAGSTVTGVAGIDSGGVSTGDGADRVEGHAVIDGTGLIETESVGIKFASIETGAGNDTVIATSSGVSVGDSSFGILDSTVSLGSGDDQVTARGLTAGVKGLFFFGEDGDDVFDLQSGTGEVDGGADDDLLILAGNSADFTYTNNGGLTGTITDGGVTDLDVAGIERFQFDDGTFDFGDLF